MCATLVCPGGVRKQKVPVMKRPAMAHLYCAPSPLGSGIIKKREQKESKGHQQWMSTGKHCLLDLTGYCTHELTVAVTACARSSQPNIPA